MKNGPELSNCSHGCLATVPLAELQARPIVLQEQAPSFDNLESEMLERFLEAKEEARRLGEALDELWLFLTPIGIVVATKPTAQFFRKVRKLQRRWNKQTSTVWPRRVRRKVKDWETPNYPYSMDRKRRRSENYVLRQFCLIGLMFHNEQHLASHEWADAERTAYGPRRQKKKSNNKRRTMHSTRLKPVKATTIPVPSAQIHVPLNRITEPPTQVPVPFA